jgi:hypothetical protein
MHPGEMDTPTIRRSILNPTIVSMSDRADARIVDYRSATRGQQRWNLMAQSVEESTDIGVEYLRVDITRLLGRA